MIAVVDYGIGNLGSVTKAFRHTGAETVLTDDHAELRRADALVLPGDGAFGATMAEIQARGLAGVLRERAEAGVPLLGICIGMQVLFDESEEHGRHQGLGLLRGRVRRFGPGLRVPHMGWNRLRARRDHPLLDGLGEDARPHANALAQSRLRTGRGAWVYFVHSYYCDAPEDVVIATADYGADFAALVGRGNVLGAQFHPEKSQAVGLRLVANFVRLVERSRAADPVSVTAIDRRGD